MKKLARYKVTIALTFYYCHLYSLTFNTHDLRLDDVTLYVLTCTIYIYISNPGYIIFIIYGVMMEALATWLPTIFEDAQLNGSFFNLLD